MSTLAMGPSLGLVLSFMVGLGLVLAACSGDSGTPESGAAVDPLSPSTSATSTSTSDATTSTTSTTSTTLPPLALGKGFSSEPCANGLPGNGCIRFGTLSDETGANRFAAPGYFAGSQAFWANRNNDGGIADSYSAEVLRAHKRDAGGDPELFATYLDDIEPDVAALSQVVGTGAVEANIGQLVNGAMVSVPVDQWSGWSFLATDVGSVLESGGSWCAHGFNAVDPAGATVGLVADESLAGRDFAAGARLGAAAVSGLVFDLTVTPISSGGDVAQQEIVAEILTSAPENVLLATGPSEAGAIVGGAVLAGFEGDFIVLEESFVPALIDPAGGVRSVFVSDQVKVISSFAPWSTDTPGHESMRIGADAIEIPAGARRAFQVGWASQYRLLAAVTEAVRSEELDRRGIVSAAARIDQGDFDGMIPGDTISSIVLSIDPDASDLFVAASEFFASDGLAEAYGEPCSSLAP